MKNLLFICGHRKSGTTLLNHLLDSHPSLAVYPHDISFLYGYFPVHIKDRSFTKKRTDFIMLLFLLLKKKPPILIHLLMQIILRGTFYL